MSFTAVDGASALVTLAILILVIVFGPLATIWAINTLFLTTIPYTLSTWAASLLLGGALTIRRK